MADRTLDDVQWFADQEAVEMGEPGIVHSYIASLATALYHVGAYSNPVQLMGASGFAFRIFVNEVMCPSAISIFDWSKILPEALEQAGHKCRYVSRLWHEDNLEKARREMACGAICEAIDHGTPAVVWDIADCEWGLIVGYDDKTRTYQTMTHRGAPSTLPYENLGQNGIDILSVAIPGDRNTRYRDEIIHNTLGAAISHARGSEWTDRPKYENGLAGFDMWATILDRWALLLKAGKHRKITPDLPRFANYYAAHHFSARCYARDYIASIADDNELLEEAAAAYKEVAAELKPVWDCFRNEQTPEHDTLSLLAEHIRQAKAVEERAVDLLDRYLRMPDPNTRLPAKTELLMEDFDVCSLWVECEVLGYDANHSYFPGTDEEMADTCDEVFVRCEVEFPSGEKRIGFASFLERGRPISVELPRNIGGDNVRRDFLHLGKELSQIEYCISNSPGLPEDIYPLRIRTDEDGSSLRDSWHDVESYLKNEWIVRKAGLEPESIKPPDE